MNKAALLIRPGLLACAATGLAQNALAQEFDQPEPMGFYFRAGVASRFNVKASITGARPLLPSGVYDNGFVLPDIGGTASGKTWNWGYNSSGQLAGGQLILSRLDNVASFGQQNLDVSNPLLGGEIIGGAYLLEFNIGKRAARLGIELGYSFSSFSSKMNFSSSSEAANLTVGAYDLNGVVPPEAPYAGNPQGPGPLINLDPSSFTTTTSPGSTAFQGTLESSLHELRLGPAIELDLTDRWMVGFGAGYSSLFVNSTLRYTETSTFEDSNFPGGASTADINRAKWSPGLYAEIRASYRFTKNLSAYLGADAQSHKNVTFGDAAHQVKIGLGSTYGVKAGVSFGF
jgi:hypothetical protein